MVPVKREDKNKSVSVYHLPVSIQHRLCNEKRKPSNYQTVKSICCRIGGYVRHGSGLLIRMVSSVENPHHPSPKVFIVWSYFKDNPQMADHVNGQNISMGSLLCAPHSHITVSSIFKKYSVCVVFVFYPYHKLICM